MKVTDSMIAVEALLLFWHNTDPAAMFDAIYGARPTDDYVIEKRRNMSRDGLIATWHSLDFPHRQKLMHKALTVYGSVANRRVRFDANKLIDASDEVTIPSTDTPFVKQS